MSCNAIFTIDNETHNRNIAYVNDIVEHGGNMEIDFANKLIKTGNITTGSYSQVNPARGMVDMHTHPNKCLNARRCALGLPSPSDMCNITVGSVMGTQVHLLYSKDGVYQIRMDKKTLIYLAGSRRLLAQHIKDVTQKLTALHQKALAHTGMNYKSYVSQWLETVTNLGYIVDLNPKSVVPSFELEYDCNKTNVDSHIIHVDIPHEYKVSTLLSMIE